MTLKQLSPVLADDERNLYVFPSNLVLRSSLKTESYLMCEETTTLGTKRAL